MNAETRILPATSDYERDGYAWAMRQARAIAERRIEEIDWANVAEEIESVGKSQRRALESNLFQIALHLLKWDAQPERRGNSWYHSIMNHRDAAEKDLRDNPSLRALLPALAEEAVGDARRRAVRETGLEVQLFTGLAYSVEDLLGREIEWRAQHD